MKVLLIHYNCNSPGAGGGGAETVTLAWREGLQARGHTVEWWTGQGPAPQDFDIALVGTMHVVDRYMRRTANAVASRPYVLFLHDYWPFCPSRMCLVENDRTCPATTDTCNNECGAFHGTTCVHTGDPWTREASEFARRSTIVVANPTTAAICERNGFHVKHILPLGVDAQMFTPAEKRDRIITSSAWAAYPTKGMHILQQACAGRTWGADVLTGLPRTRVAEELATSTVYIFPSCYEETWGLCLTEAMACGCACIASDVAGPKAQIRDGETGILVRRRDPMALRRAVETVLCDRAMAARLGAAARAAVEREFTITRMAERLEHILMEELSNAEQKQGSGAMGP